jgi:hypothetical protein
MSTKDQQKIVQLMALLQCTEEEARQVIEDDKAIDKGQKMNFDLTKEQEKIARSYAKTQTHKITEPAKRERKPNLTKSGIITEIARFLTENSESGVENVEIINTEKLIQFRIGENTFEIDLKQKRKAKK